MLNYLWICIFLLHILQTLTFSIVIRTAPKLMHGGRDWSYGLQTTNSSASQGETRSQNVIGCYCDKNI